MSTASADLRRREHVSVEAPHREAVTTEGSFGRGFLVAMALAIPFWIALVGLVVAAAKLLG